MQMRKFTDHMRGLSSLPLMLLPLLLLLLPLRLHDLRISLFFQLLKCHVRPNACLLLLNCRALNGLIEINGGVVVKLA